MRCYSKSHFRRTGRCRREKRFCLFCSDPMQFLPAGQNSCSAELRSSQDPHQTDSGTESEEDRHPIETYRGHNARQTSASDSAKLSIRLRCSPKCDSQAQSRQPETQIVVFRWRSEEHTSELQSQFHLVCRLLLEKKKIKKFLAIRRGIHEVAVVLQQHAHGFSYDVFFFYYQDCPFLLHTFSSR